MTTRGSVFTRITRPKPIYYYAGIKHESFRKKKIVLNGVLKLISKKARKIRIYYKYVRDSFGHAKNCFFF